MSLTTFIWIAMYFTISWLLTDILDIEDDVARMAFFIAWPLVLTAFLLMATAYISFGLIYLLANLIYILFLKGD